MKARHLGACVSGGIERKLKCVQRCTLTFFAGSDCGKTLANRGQIARRTTPLGASLARHRGQLQNSVLLTKRSFLSTISMRMICTIEQRWRGSPRRWCGPMSREAGGAATTWRRCASQVWPVRSRAAYCCIPAARNTASRIGRRAGNFICVFN